MDSARCLLAESKIERRFWPEVVCAAAYLKNRTIANTLVRNKSLYEIFFNEKPDAKYLKLYGSKVFVRVSESKRNSKWDRKADLGILIGYDVVGYRVLIGNKVIVASHVDVIQKDIKCIGFNDIDEGNGNNNDLILPPTSTLAESRESKTDLKNLNENLNNNENDENEV